MKRIIGLILICAMAVSLLAGCAQSGGNAASTTTAAATTAAAAATTAAPAATTAAPAATTAAPAATTAAPAATTAPAAPSAAAYTKENVTSAGTLPIVKEMEEFSLMIGANERIIDFETNEVTKLQEERTNVHILWQVVAEYTQSKNLALASGDMPDVFGSALSNSDLVTYGSDGTFVDLTPFIDEYGYWILQMFDYDASVKPSITIPGGIIPAMPDYSLTYHGYSNQKGWVRMDWLEKLGLAYPDTIDDFHDMLVAFRDNDPNGNGQKDEIPFSGVGCMTGLYNTVAYLMNAFIPYRVSAGEYWVEPYDGVRPDVVYNKDEFYQGLVWINSLYAEGLIDPESFTQDSKLATQKTTNDLVGFRVAHAVSGIVDTQSEIFEKFDIVLPLTGPSGKKVAPLTGGSGVVGKRFAITEACKNPATAFRWQDSMYDEDVQLWLAIGLEGIEWRKPEAGEVGINGLPALYTLLERTYPTNDTWNQSIASFRTSEWRLGEASVYGDNYFIYPAQETRLYVATVEYMKYCPWTVADVVPYTIYVDPSISEEYGDMKTALDDYVQQNVAMFITGDRPLSDWDAYCADIEGLGLSQYLDWTQEAIASAN